MKKNKIAMVIRIILLVIVSSVFLLTVRYQEAFSENMPLDIFISLEKEKYMDCEMISVHTKLTNEGSANIWVAPLRIWQGYLIVDLKVNREITRPKTEWAMLAFQERDAVLLEPDKSISNVWDLIFDLYPLGLDPGLEKYNIQVIYDTSNLKNTAPKIWHGKVKSNQLKFVVEPPPVAEEKPFKIFQRGRFLMITGGGYNRARDNLTYVATNYPKSIYAQYAQYFLSELMRQKRYYNEAIKEYRKFIKNYGVSTFVPKAQYSIGDCYLSLGENDEAYLAYGKVITEYPQSAIVTSAKAMRERLKRIK